MPAHFTPTSRCRLGIGRSDITPPVGIYHRFWGAAKHDRATGVHRPLLATVLIIEPYESGSTNEHTVMVALDHCILRPPELAELTAAVCQLTGEDASQLTITFSHTHSGGNLCKDRVELPGGELIVPYLESLPEKIAAAYHAARAASQTAILTYGATTCDMARQRDFWDEQQNRYVCGFNPQGQCDQSLVVARATNEQGGTLATIVNYACHPTTLAWENTLISPDYIGALRETVEQATAAPCLFLLSPCGDVGPRDGFVGDPAVADRNGRQVGYAALSVLQSLPAAAEDFHYIGPVLSGATLGAWEYRPHSANRTAETGCFQHHRWQVPLDYLDGLPTAATVEAELKALIAQESQARKTGDDTTAHELRVLAERKRRLLERIAPLPPGEHYPYTVEMAKLGDAIWIAIEGEPYNLLQQELRQSFPHTPLIITVLASGARASYLPRQEDYGKALYQTEIALLAPGALETLIQAIANQITKWTGREA
ncbi:neutral/alkaline non-lysosomal ceramidase N-terminal domain-containing protein [Symmachiella dynata]|uniref:neutral/alkaline non-lysosomal ceramidase N-terminal domain-containing protein n=1 Tax=Symmachiella dynata TaxID=2527995 RepID=UPI0030EDDB1F